MCVATEVDCYKKSICSDYPRSKQTFSNRREITESLVMWSAGNVSCGVTVSDGDLVRSPALHMTFSPFSSSAEKVLLVVSLCWLRSYETYGHLQSSSITGSYQVVVWVVCDVGLFLQEFTQLLLWSLVTSLTINHSPLCQEVTIFQFLIR